MGRRVQLLINSLGGGGAEKQVSYLLQNDVAQKVFILENQVDYDIPQNKINLLFKCNWPKALKYFKFLLIGPFKLASNIEKDDIVLSFLEISNFINILCSILFKKHKAVVSVRISPSFYDHKPLGFLFKFLIKKLYPCAHLITTNSEVGRQELIQMLGVKPEKIHTIRNAIDIDRVINLSREEVFYKSDYINLVTIGRLSQQKNYISLLPIFARLKKEHNLKIRLFILGDGPLKSSLENLATLLDLETSDDFQNPSDINFLGFQINPYKFVGKDNIFILCSLYEGLPNVLIEAMACGAPIISSDCNTGPRELLDPNNLSKVNKLRKAEFGYLLPVDCPQTNCKDTWVEGLLEFIRDQEARKIYSEKGVERSKFYSVPNVIGDWNKLLDRL